jgi:hypothetical protein
MCEFVAARSENGELVIADEGVLHQAHSLFVHPERDPDWGEVREFAALATVPAALLVVRTPVPILVARLLERGHQRMKERNPDKVAIFVSRAQRVLECVANEVVNRCSVRVCEGFTKSQGQQIVESVLDWSLSVSKLTRDEAVTR